MKYFLAVSALAVVLLMLSGCAVNVVTVNVTGSELGYVDQGVSETINESNLGGTSMVLPDAPMLPEAY